MAGGVVERTERINQITGLVLIALTTLIILSLVSYNPADTNLITSYPNSNPSNFAGVAGAYFSQVLFLLLGGGAFLIPFLTAGWGILKLNGRSKEIEKPVIKILGSVILLISISAIFSLRGVGIEGAAAERIVRGGIIGFRFSGLSATYFGIIGSYVILITLFILSILLTTGSFLFSYLPSLVRNLTDRISGWRKKRLIDKAYRPGTERIEKKRRISRPSVESSPEVMPRLEVKTETKPIIKHSISDNRRTASVIGPSTKPVAARSSSSSDKYKLPSLELLDSPPPVEKRKIIDDLNANAKVLEETLKDFGIDVKVTEINRGPVITRYEILPAPGVKVNRIVALNEDLALVMKARSIRIVAPIPGKAAVGIEVPNSITTLVYLREIIESSQWQGSSSKLKLALGKDIAGIPVVDDLSAMPHLLIAGATGSGKTVCVNTIIIGLLFSLPPDRIKFLMVDPKRVELAIFNDLPHLICPVVTEPSKVAGALSWVVNEMEERYKIFARLGLRNIDVYNQKLTSGKLGLNGETLKPLPYLVIIIDELADLMAIAQEKIENHITRLAQLSRAVGIHIVLATQRPSVDVLTGVIKANFPARISFKVATKVDSRTVLDANGADKLLGNGDFLFLKPGVSKPIRGQGTLISDKEIERVVGFIKSQESPQYNEELLKSFEEKASRSYFEQDELFAEAARMVLETKQASVSMLQRRMRLGYTRAARLIDAMEEKGIVGSYRGSRPREILVDRWEEDQDEVNR